MVYVPFSYDTCVHYKDFVREHGTGTRPLPSPVSLCCDRPEVPQVSKYPLVHPIVFHINRILSVCYDENFCLVRRTN